MVWPVDVRHGKVRSDEMRHDRVQARWGTARHGMVWYDEAR